MNYALEFKLAADSSGESHTLYEDGAYIKTWFILYGYNTPEWQEQERKDRKAMRDDLEARGLLHLLNEETT